MRQVRNRVAHGDGPEFLVRVTVVPRALLVQHRAAFDQERTPRRIKHQSCPPPLTARQP